MDKIKENLVTPAVNFDVTGIIEQGCEFEGKLTFQGTMRINGAFKGDVFTSDILIIGESAEVEGNISAGVVIIYGRVVGDIKATHRVEIHSPAIFKGEILTPSLSVDEGVIFDGKSKMASRPICDA